MTDHNTITRRTIVTALPVAAVLPVGSHIPDAALPGNPMDRIRQHARAIRDIMRSIDNDWLVTIDVVNNELNFTDVS